MSTKTTEHAEHTEERRYIVRWRGYAVMFHPLCDRKVYSLVPKEDATRFPDPEAALEKAIEHHLGFVEVETI